MIELCFTHADLGQDALYRPLATKCLETWEAVTGAPSAQFRDMTSPHVGAGRKVIRKDFTRNQFSLKRTECLKDYARHARGNLVATDCDMEWRASPAPLFDEDFDIGLCWRTGNPGMPYYAGFVMVRHGSEAAIQFLTEWWFTIANLPAEAQTWWGDQWALAAMLGRGEPNTTKNFMGAKVRLFDAGRVFFNMQAKDQTPPDGIYATHVKGFRKE